MNLVKLADDSNEKFGEITKLIFDDTPYTNRYMLNSSNQLAHGLIRAGIRQGDRVVVMMMNSPQVLISYQAILRAGAIIVPVIFLLGPREIAHILKNSEATAIITSNAFLPTVHEAAKGIDSLKHILIIEDQEVPGTRTVRQVGQDCPEANRPDIRIDDGDKAVILYTSGTTGVPKGVVLSHQNLYSNALSSYKNNIDLPPDQVGLFVLPLSHSYGLTAMNVGYMFPNMSVMMPWFELETACRLIEKYKVHGFAGVPAIFAMFLNTPEVVDRYDLSSLSECASGSAPLPLEVLKGFENKFDCIIYEGYGLSEAAPIVSSHRRGGKRKPGSIGLPVPDVQVKVVDPDGNVLSVNEVGELIVKGANISSGYYKMKDKTTETFKDGWLYTGDMARIDEEGYIFIVDRKKDLIIRGGFNILPRDIEEVLHQHPAVTEAAVVGVPDPVMGEEVKAFIALHPGSDVSEEEVIAHCREHLARYKCPRYVSVIDALPRNSIGKILKTDLRKMAARQE